LKVISAVTPHGAVVTSAAIDVVVALLTQQGVVAGVTLQVVIALAALDQGTGDDTNDLILVGEGENFNVGEDVCSIGRAAAGVLNGEYTSTLANQIVAAITAISDDVNTAAPINTVVAGTAADPVVTAAGIDAVAAALGNNRIVIATTEDGIAVVAAIDRVVAIAAIEERAIGLITTLCNIIFALAAINGRRNISVG
jgi:hypothetical protein